MGNYLAVGDDAPADILSNPPTGTTTIPSADQLKELQRQLNRFAMDRTPAAFKLWTTSLEVTGAPDGGVTAQRASQVAAQYWAETQTLQSQLNASAALNYGGLPPDTWLVAQLPSLVAIVTGYANARGLPSAESGLFTSTNIAIFVGGGLLWYLLTQKGR